MPARPRARRLQPGRTYRDAVLAELAPERKAVAELILRGGIPAVRQALEEQNAKAREVGGPEIKADALLAVAEELLPAIRAAEWRDRAEAAVVILDEISVRDLRAVVSGADTARDEEGRSLAARLREALDRRAAADRQAWIDEITSSLDDGRVVRALRISGRPPEPGVRFPAELAKRLSDAGGEALAPETTPDRWAAVLEAVVGSPVRRTITPRGLPADPGDELTRHLRLAAPRVPALAALLGDPPGLPPPRPPKPGGSHGGPGPTRPPGRPTTPPPPRTDEPPSNRSPTAGGGPPGEPAPVGRNSVHDAEHPRGREPAGAAADGVDRDPVAAEGANSATPATGNVVTSGSPDETRPAADVPERSIPEPPEPLPARQAAHDAGAEPPAASEATDEPPGADEGATARYEGLPATAPVPSVLLPADEVVDEREPSAEPA